MVRFSTFLLFLVSVIFQADAAIEFTLICGSNCHNASQIDAHGDIEISGECVKECAQKFDYSWELESKPGNIKQFFGPEDTLGINTSFLTIFANVLRCGEIYDLAFTMKHSGGTKVLVTELGMQKCSRKYPPGEENEGSQLEYEYTDFSYVDVLESDRNLSKAQLFTKIEEQMGVVKTMYNKTNTNAIERRLIKILNLISLMPWNSLTVRECQKAANLNNKAVFYARRSRESMVKKAMENNVQAGNKVVSLMPYRDVWTGNSIDDYNYFFNNLTDIAKNMHHQEPDSFSDHRAKPTQLPGADADAGLGDLIQYPDYNDFDFVYRQRKQTYQEIMFLRLENLAQYGLASCKAKCQHISRLQYYGSIGCSNLFPWHMPDTEGYTRHGYNGEDLKNVEKQTNYNPCSIFINVKENLFLKPTNFYRYVYHAVGKYHRGYFALLETAVPFMIKVYYDFRVSKAVPGYFRMPYDADPSEVLNEYLGIHEITVEAPINAIAVRVSDLRRDHYQLCVRRGRHPTAHDFEMEPLYHFQHSSSVKENRFYAIKASPGDKLYLAIVPSENLRAIQRKDNNKGYRPIRYRIQMTQIQCAFVNQSTRSIEPDSCRLTYRWIPRYWNLNDAYLCYCSKYGYYEYVNVPLSSRFLGFPEDRPPPPPRDLPPKNYVPAIISGAFIGLLVLASLVKVVHRKRTIIAKTVKHLMDNNLEHKFPYILVVTSQNSTTANIVFRLYGTEHTTPAHLFRGQSEPVLQNNSDDYFYLLAEKDLGELEALELWSDCSGFKPGWLCARIKVINEQTQQEWLFQVNDWITPIEKASTKTIPIENPEKVYYFQSHYYARQGLHNHLWLNAFTRLQSPQFSFCERLNVILAIIILNMALSLCLLKMPYYDQEFWFLDYPDINVNWYEIGSACLSGLASFFISLILIRWFTKSKRFGAGKVTDDVRYGKSRRIIGWILMLSIQFGGLAFVNWIGLYMETNSCVVWSYIFPIGILISIVFECVRAAIDGYYNKTIIPKVITIDYKSIETQRDKVMRGLGPEGMRPLLQKYYKKLPDEEAKERECYALELKTLQFQKKELITYIFYMLVLIVVVLYYRDPLTHHSANNIREIFIEDKFIRKIELNEINSQKRFLRYLREVFLPAIHTTHWYGHIGSATPGRLKDFKTRILGVARIRQVRIHNDTCIVPDDVKSIVEDCHAEYSIFRQDTINYGEFWLPYNASGAKWESDSSWFYTSWFKMKALPFNGEFAVYHGGGYTMSFGRTWSNSRIIYRYIKDTNWIDHLTRAIFLDVNLFNANENLLNFLTIAVEQSATGAYVTNYQLNTVQFLYRDTTIWIVFPIFVAALSFFIFTFSWGIFYQYKEFYNSDKKVFFSDFWNWVDPIIIFLIVALLIMFVIKNFVMDINFKEETLTSIKFHSYYGLIVCHNMIELIATCLIGFSTLRMWKLLRFLRAFRLLELTLVFSAWKLLIMMIMNVLLIMVYAGVGFLLLGPYVKKFRTIWTSFVALMLISFGLEFNLGLELDHQTMYFYSGILYFAGYLILVLVLLNIFITIIVVNYNNSKMYFDQLPKTNYTLRDYLRDDCAYKTDKNKGRITNVAILKEVNQELKNLRLRAGQEPLTRKLETNTSKILIYSQRMLEMHQLVEKAATLMQKKLKYTEKEKHEQALKVLGHYYYRFSHEKQKESVQNEEYIVVPDSQQDFVYVSLERQKEIKAIADYLLNQDGDEKKSPQWVLQHTKLFEEQLEDITNMHRKVDDMVALVKKLLQESCADETTQVTFADLGLEEWARAVTIAEAAESGKSTEASASTSEEIDFDVIDGNIQIHYKV